MNKQKRVIIIHGAYGYPDENWFPWLADQVERAGHLAYRPALPTPQGQELGNWRRQFAEQVGKLSPMTVLVGHSLGPGFILDLLERAPVPVQGTFLVGGFLGKLGLPDFDSVNESFVCRDFDWPRIRQNAGITRIYNSDNDPYVPLERGRELAALLGVELQVIRGGGHINAAAGFTKFDRLWVDMQSVL
jgi:uncharacterized protein